MLKFTFNCFNQLLMPNSYSFMDKINISFTLISLFALFAYSLCFYPIMYKMRSKQSSKVLLTKTKYSLKSFYFETVSIVFRNFNRAFVHSFFIANYSLQISLLAATDIFYLMLIIKMRKHYLNKFLAFICFLYSFAFFCFDLFFALKANLNESSL